MSWFSPQRIFLDYASATPVLPEVRQAMEKYHASDFYNPNAIYEEGLRTKRVVEDCRTRIAKILGVAKENIIFTSGGTEANTIAVRGIKPNHILVDADTHPSVLEAAAGLPLKIREVGKEIELEERLLISSLATDNTLGRKVREMRKKNGAAFPLLHVDATQSTQYVPVGLEALACDLITLDSAKIYGPKGIGALIVKKGIEIDIPPRGTPPVALIVGFTKALEIMARDRAVECIRIEKLASDFGRDLQEALPHAEIRHDFINTVNVSIPGVLPELLVLALEREGILVSAGPACNANKPEPPETPVRVSLGRQSTQKELNRAVKAFCQVVQNVLK